MSMKLEGFDKLDGFLNGLASRDNFDPALDEGAEIGLKEMQRLTPVDTGELRDSEHIEKPAVNQRDWVADAEHAIFVEMGTSRMRPQPFMRPAVYGKAKKILQSVSLSIQKIIGKMVR